MELLQCSPRLDSRSLSRGSRCLHHCRTLDQGFRGFSSGLFVSSQMWVFRLGCGPHCSVCTGDSRGEFCYWFHLLCCKDEVKDRNCTQVSTLNTENSWRAAKACSGVAVYRAEVFGTQLCEVSIWLLTHSCLSICLTIWLTKAKSSEYCINTSHVDTC